MTEARRLALDLAPARTVRTDNSDGGFTLASPEPLADYAGSICAFLHHWAEAAPDRVFLADRGRDCQWRRLGYAAALGRVRALAAALLARGLGAADPVMIVSDNSLESGLIQLAAMYVGIPVVPVSPAYSLMSDDHARLTYIAGLVEPKLVFAEDGRRFENALAAIHHDDLEVVVAHEPPAGLSSTPFDTLLAGEGCPAVDAAHAAIGPDTLAKILFTSGSTGPPKGVRNTQRMLCANQEALRQVWPFLGHRPPVLVDWLPWNHTFGGNHNIGLVLRNGGTLYIDRGKPTPALIDETVANLRETSPTIYFNVPRGYAMLLPHLEADVELRDRFFAELDLLFYAGAALPQDLWQRLERLSLAARGALVPMISAWGSTETAPAATCAHFPVTRAGVIGLPLPGTEIKFVPAAGKLEMRVRGPQVTPGYYKRDDLTAAAFDEDGFYLIGDAGRLADPDDPAKGIVFDGRIAEEFKLLTGTWVSAGEVRIAAIDAAAPLIQDAVVTGHDRDEVGLLAFPNADACRTLASLASDVPLAEVIASEALRAALCDAFARYNAAHPASSTRIARLLLLAEPPSIDANEITDKGYINQRAVLECRAGLVQVLYSDDPSVIRT